jgi:hypothetical protein
VVDLKLEVIGDEIPDTEITFRRTVWTDDQDDLASTMHYAVERTHLDPSDRAESGSEYDAALAARTDLRTFFTTHPDEVIPSNRQLYQRMRLCGYEHADDAIRDAVGDLIAEGVVSTAPGSRSAKTYWLTKVEP